jgi:predicted transcriptional regulator
VKTLKVGIATYEEMKARTLAIAKGKLKPAPDDPKVWFTSAESFARVLSNRNRALLGVIADSRPESLSALASATGRTPGNLSRTLRTMERYGIVKLQRGERGALKPEVPYRSIELALTV